MEWQPTAAEKGDYRELVQSLGYLPLALHLAAGHLRSGRSVASFLRVLRQRRLALIPAHRSELADGTSEGARKVLATSFSLSIEILREELGSEAQRLLPGLHALGHAPLSGFGRSLGASLAVLSEEDFEELVFHAQKLGLLLPIPRQERPDGAWRIHTLLGEFLGAAADSSQVMERMTEWFLVRLPDGTPGKEVDQGRRWREIKIEGAALAHWLPRIPSIDRSRVRAATTFFPLRNGPFHLWIEFCEAALRDLTDAKQRSDFFWTLSNVALRHGLLERALQGAQEKLEIDVRLKDEFEMAMSWVLIGDILQARGLLDEATAVWQRQLPILEKLGKEQEGGLVLYRIARVLKAQGASTRLSRYFGSRFSPHSKESRTFAREPWPWGNSPTSTRPEAISVPPSRSGRPKRSPYTRCLESLVP